MKPDFRNKIRSLPQIAFGMALPLLAAGPGFAQGWGNVAKKEEETGFSWSDPLWPSFWMAWTPATFAFFCALFAAIAIIGISEAFRYKDGLERKGILGLTTTLGDRLFISLLGSAYIFLAWLGFIGQPVWWPLIISLAWMVFCFKKV